jgi:hypothetical protein
MGEMIKEIEEILEKDCYYNGARVGDIEPCDKCGEYSLKCISDIENAGTGVHTWLFFCPCGNEAYEHW